MIYTSGELLKSIYRGETMKLQNMSVIFIIIIIPIILVISYYIGNEIKTITLQNSYNTKLRTAANDSIKALEINTVEWNSAASKLADSRRRDISASINSFVTGLANSMGLSGASKERMQSYVPAIAYTMYDGYYIYSASLMKNQDLNEDGLTKFNTDGSIKTTGSPTYQYVLKPYSPYSARYVYGSTTDITVNYTLDNYIKIYGKVNDVSLEKEGYLVVCDDEDNGIGTLNSDSINNIIYKNAQINPETLKEQILYKTTSGGSTTNNIEEYSYVYDKDKNKVYYDSTGRFFTISNSKEKKALSKAKSNNDKNEFLIYNRFKKIAVPINVSGEYKVQILLQLLNPSSDDGTAIKRKVI